MDLLRKSKRDKPQKGRGVLDREARANIIPVSSSRIGVATQVAVCSARTTIKENPMHTRVCASLLIGFLTVSQILGPATLWAAEERGIRIDESRRLMIAAIDGPSLTVQKGSETKTAQFREVVNVGERLLTGDRTMAEVLIGTRAVVTLGPGTTMQMVTVSDEQAVIQVNQGLVRVAAAPSRLGPQGVVIVQTPTGQVQTRGGIVRVLVETPVGKAEPVPTGEGKAYRAAYVPERIAAVTSSSSELIQVDEGTAEIFGSGGKSVTIQAGQRVALESGKAGMIGEGVKPEIMRLGVVATQGHNQTPKEGREYLVALQVDQAAKLGKALTGAAETSQEGESEKKSDTKNTINGATAGVGDKQGSNSIADILFGSERDIPRPNSSQPQETTSTGSGGFRNNGPFIVNDVEARVGLNNPKALLVFTRKDAVTPFVNIKDSVTLDSAFFDFTKGADGKEVGSVKPKEDGSTTEFKPGDTCPGTCIATLYYNAYKNQDDPTAPIVYNPNNPKTPVPPIVGYRQLDPLKSDLTVSKELLLIGGSSNTAHGGVVPNEQLIVRGALGTNQGIFPSNRDPANLGAGSSGINPTPPVIVAANSTYVVQTPSVEGAHQADQSGGGSLIGGTLGQYSGEPSLTGGKGLVLKNVGNVNNNGTSTGEASSVVAAITGTVPNNGGGILLKGGVALDQGTTVTIGMTDATRVYFDSRAKDFTGSLLSVINGPTGATKLTMQERMLGVYDGSIIQPDQSKGGKALLSVLDAKLVGPSGNVPLIDIAAGTHFDRDGKATSGTSPSVTVTSAIVTRSTTELQAATSSLDAALLNASAPLIALTQATMTTTSHFADMAGKGASAGPATQSLNLNGALVALSASTLTIKTGHLLNLNDATAAITGYLFSLDKGSTLDIQKGGLFSLNNSELALKGNAFGVFGDGRNTLTINNDLCTTGCRNLVDSAGNPITLPDGTTLLKVAGVTHDVALPKDFKVFTGNGAQAQLNIGADDALFQVKGNSQLTINNVKVVQ